MKFLPRVVGLKTRASAIKLPFSTACIRSSSTAYQTTLLLESLDPTPKTLYKRKVLHAELEENLRSWNDRYSLRDVSMYRYAYDLDEAPVELAIVDEHPPTDADVTDSPLYDASSVAASLEKEGYRGTFYSPLAAKINALENAFAKAYNPYVPWPTYSGQEPKGYAYPPVLRIESTPSLKKATFHLSLPGPYTMPLFNLFKTIYKTEDARKALALVFAWTRQTQMTRFSSTTIAIMLGAILKANPNMNVQEILSLFFRHWSNVDYLSAQAVSISNMTKPFEDPDKNTYNESPFVVQDPFVPTKNHAERISLMLLRRFKDACTAALTSLEANEPLHQVLRLGPPLGHKTLITGELVPDDDGNFDIEYIHRKYLTSAKELLQRRRKTLNLVQRTLQKAFGREYTVTFFGSIRYDVTLPKSDLDMVLLDPTRKNGLGPGVKPTEVYDVRRVANALRKAKFTHIEVIPQAAVPIVKFRDPRTGFDCDININERLGLHNSKMVNDYCRASPLLRPLLMLIKLWAKPLDLNSPAALRNVKHWPSFSSYAFAMMTISFMQLRGLLPNLQDKLPPLGPDDTTGVFWTRTSKGELIKCDVRYHREVEGWEPSNYPSLKSVLKDWFSYWAHEFNYDQQLVSIRHGGIYESVVGNESELDQDGVDIRTSSITVLDPFIKSKNVTRAISSKVVKRFIGQCEEAAQVLENATSLKDLIKQTDIPGFGIKQKVNGKTKKKKKTK